MKHGERFDINGATVTVWHDGRDYSPEDSGYRQRYGYKITTKTWEYIGNDIRSGCGAAPDVSEAARTLFGFLAACAESRAYVTRSGGRGENADLFPEYVGQWAEENSDDLSILSLEEE